MPLFGCPTAQLIAAPCAMVAAWRGCCWRRNSEAREKESLATWAHQCLSIVLLLLIFWILFEYISCTRRYSLLRSLETVSQAGCGWMKWVEGSEAQPGRFALAVANKSVIGDSQWEEQRRARTSTCRKILSKRFSLILDANRDGTERTEDGFTQIDGYIEREAVELDTSKQCCCCRCSVCEKW